MFLIMLVGLAFVFPLAVYCALLASLNRRNHAVMVSGSWDFLEVLLASSGFLLFGGPCVLTSFDERWREYWLFGRTRGLQDLREECWLYWAVVLGLYFAILLGVSGYLLWRRRLATAIYNVTLVDFEVALSRVLERLRLNWIRGDNRIFINGRGQASEPNEEEALLLEVVPDTEGLAPLENSSTATLPAAEKFSSTIVLELAAFPVMRHVTLQWSSDKGSLRSEIEAELANELAKTSSGVNPVGIWLISIATCLFLVMCFTILYFAILIYQVKTKKRESPARLSPPEYPEKRQKVKDKSHDACARQGSTLCLWPDSGNY